MRTKLRVASAQRALGDFVTSNRALSAGRRMAAAMALLESRLDRHSRDLCERTPQRMERLVAELRERLVAVRAGGGAEATEKHRQRNKLTARERIDRLVDPGSDFLELSALAAYGMYDDDSPAAGIVTGIGIVEGQHCVDRRQRRDRQGRHVLPDDGEEASARAGDRRAESSAVHLSWSIRAARSCRCKPRSFPIAITSDASSTTKRACRASASRRSPR